MPVPKVGKLMQIVALPIKTPWGLLLQDICLLPLKCKTRTKSTGWRFFCWGFGGYGLKCFLLFCAVCNTKDPRLPYPLPESWRGVCELQSRKRDGICLGPYFCWHAIHKAPYVVIRYLIVMNSIFWGFTQLHISHKLWGFLSDTMLLLP